MDRLRRRLLQLLRRLELLVGEATRWLRWLARRVELLCCLVVAARRMHLVWLVRLVVWLVDLLQLRARRLVRRWSVVVDLLWSRERLLHRLLWLEVRVHLRLRRRRARRLVLLW